MRHVVRGTESTGPDPDIDLVSRAQEDPAAFEALYERYVDRIYTYVHHRVGDVDDAEDLTARTFHRALSALPSYVDVGAPFSAWLFRIAHNVVANWIRDCTRHPTVALERARTRLDISDHRDILATQTVTAVKVRMAISGLGRDRQELLLLKFGDGLSNAEIGVVLGRSEGAVKSLYHRTLIELRARLDERVRPATLEVQHVRHD